MVRWVLLEGLGIPPKDRANVHLTVFLGHVEFVHSAFDIPLVENLLERTRKEDARFVALLTVQKQRALQNGNGWNGDRHTQRPALQGFPKSSMVHCLMLLKL